MVQDNKVKNILTVDVEEAFHRNDIFLTSKQRLKLEGRFLDQTQRLISLLRSEGQGATFFILGEIADRYPDIVRIIIKNKFEVASHGYGHRLVYKQKKNFFCNETIRSKSLLEEIGGVKVIGFRAPSWSITAKSLWALPLLADIGFKYDSSILPSRVNLGGIYYSNRFIHYRPDANIIEIPPSIINLWGIHVPFSGGLYLRVLPYTFLRSCIRKLNKKGIRAVIYLHPWEMDIELPRLPLGIKGRFALYHNLDTVPQKVEQLLNDFSFISVREALENKASNF
jgi:polysaccharide deacetylase family protein (PEP-CTERM system associated)